MRRFFLYFLVATTTATMYSQELNCTISIDANQTGQPNQQVFSTLEQQLTEFLNTTKWTDKVYKNQERIDCNMSIIISEYDGDSFVATVQVQSSRTIFDSTYDSPVYNYNDRQLSFRYTEFEPLTFNINSFDSNLISTLAYHAYTIIGLDADTYELNGGKEYFEIAKQIVNTAASSNFKGWKPTDGTQSRYRYNDAMLSSVYSEYHTALYDYHRLGLDMMSKNQRDAKLQIIEAIAKLKSINDRRPNSFILRTFFDAKSEEIQSVFSGGPKVDVATLLENLNRMAPTKRNNWTQIKF